MAPSDIVLEIGPGRGDLTSLIIDKAKMVYAVEIDKNLCGFLQEKFRDKASLKLINADILDFNIGRGIAVKDKIKVIGNLPYYITTPIIEHLFKSKDKIKEMFFTVQKEFALRLVAEPGSKTYGSFSCFVQYHAIPKINFFIKRGSFLPHPKVDSAFLTLTIRKKPKVDVADEGLLFKLIRMSFNQRRKTLKNSLKGLASKDKLASFFASRNLNDMVRAEELSLEDFASLANSLLIKPRLNLNK